MVIVVISDGKFGDRLYLDAMLSGLLSDIYTTAEIISPERDNTLCMVSEPNWSFHFIRHR